MLTDRSSTARKAPSAFSVVIRMDATYLRNPNWQPRRCGNLQMSRNESMTTSKNYVLIAGLAILTIGCSSSGNGTTDSGTQVRDNPPPNIPPVMGGTTSGSTAIAATASYTAVQEIFAKSCAACHG